ncbi:MAG: phosphonate ABC transporter, permease protein PhnE [Lachnospiraceae bacterium]|nr:phosphonate ABC transporter, permease protein PhnE [Lachnospiraceae bacterium]
MASLYDKIFKPKTITLENGHSVTKKASRVPLILLILLLAIVGSGKITGFNISTLVENGSKFFDILKKIFTPDFSYWNKVWQPLLDTIKMSVMGTFIGCALGLPVAVIASSNIVHNKAVISVTRFILSIVRTLPTLVIALIATFIFDLGTFAGTVAISIFTFGIVAKMIYENIETVDMGAYEAVEALGGSKPRAFLAAIFPQIVPYYLSTCLYCLEMNLRHAAILGYVGAGGIGIILQEKIGWREYEKVGTILFMLFCAVFILENISRYFRKKLV